jgi:hypothetical protein
VHRSTNRQLAARYCRSFVSSRAAHGAGEVRREARGQPHPHRDHDELERVGKPDRRDRRVPQETTRSTCSTKLNSARIQKDTTSGPVIRRSPGALSLRAGSPPRAVDASIPQAALITEPPEYRRTKAIRRADKRFDEPAALGVVRRDEAHGGVVHVDQMHGEPGRCGKSRAIASASSAPVFTPRRRTHPRWTGPRRASATRAIARASSGSGFARDDGTSASRFSGIAEVKERISRWTCPSSAYRSIAGTSPTVEIVIDSPRILRPFGSRRIAAARRTAS